MTLVQNRMKPLMWGVVIAYFLLIAVGVWLRFAPPTASPDAAVEPEPTINLDSVVVIGPRETTPVECMACHAHGINGGPHP